MYIQDLSRRRFLQTTACGVVAAGTGRLSVLAQGTVTPKYPKPLLPAGVFGRTGYPVTLVSFGSIRIAERLGTRILKMAIDRGVNLVHTSINYGNGKAIHAVGDLLKNEKSYRDKIFLCLKSFNPEKLDKEIDEMFKILGTDHAEVVMTELHDPEPARLEAIQKQQDLLKKKGKVRYTGFVCHVDMNGVMEMVLDKAPGYFDTALLSTALLSAASQPAESESARKRERFLKNLKAFREKGVGVLSMKSGAQSAIKEGPTVFGSHVMALLEAGVDSVLSTLNAIDQVDMISKLPLKSPHSQPGDQQAAANGLRRTGACLMCGDCTKACPQGLPVSDLMRFRMYHDEYGWPDHARAEYASMGLNWLRLSESCVDCSACNRACSVGLAGSEAVRRISRILA